MKKSHLILSIIFLMIVSLACQKEEIETFSGSDHIYFRFAYATQSSGSVIDSTYISFGYDPEPKTDSILSIPVQVMGNIEDYEREFSYIVVDTSSTGVINKNYEILPSYVNAGSRYGILNFKLLNTEELADTTLVVCLRLVNNEHFGTDVREFFISSLNDQMSPIEYFIYFDNTNEMPNLWKDYSRISMFFGPYSKVKLEFLMEVLGVDISFFTYDPATEDPSVVGNLRFSSVTVYGYVAMFNRALLDYYETNGEWLLDENGEEVRCAKNYEKYN